MAAEFVLVKTPEGETLRYEIGSGTLRIGRSLQNDLILKDQHVSRHHAEIVRHPEGCYVVDIGAKAGIKVNGSPSERPVLLRPGDTIQIGRTLLVFQGESSGSVVFDDRPVTEGPGTLIVGAQAGAAYPTLDALRGTESIQLSASAGSSSSPHLEASTAESVSSPLSLFAQADRELLYHRPLKEVFEKTMDLAGVAVPFDRGVLMLREGERWIQAAVRSPGGKAGEPIPISRTLADRVLHKRESFLTTDALSDDRFKAGESVLLQRIRSAMCVPLWNNREVIGLVYVDSQERTDLFTQENLQVLAHLANIAAVKIENCRLFEKTLEAQTLEREIRQAAEIQRHLLPASDPSIPGYQAHGESIPCHAVGGDYFEYFELPEGRFGLALGDISGKGFSASLLMCSFQASLVALAEMGLPPLEVILQLNRVLSRRFPESRFVTFFYAVLDPASHTLTYVNAGHCPPLLLSAGGEHRTLAQTGRPLGIFEQSPYTQASVSLQAGERLIGFTDGIPGARNPAGEWYGEDRILHLGKETAGLPVSDIAGKVLADTEQFLAGKPREDDFTVLVLGRNP